MSDSTTEMPLSCPQWTKNEKYVEHMLSVSIHHQLACILGVIGVILNFLCIKTFYLGQLQYAFVSRLYVLITSINTMSLVVSIVSGGQEDFTPYHFLFYTMIYQLREILRCWAIFVTLAVAWDKYQFIKHPDTYQTDEKNIRRPKGRFFDDVTKTC